MIYPVLEFREEKQTFAKVEEGNVDFFHLFIGPKTIEPRLQMGSNN
jgi:hypothetical protein